MYRYSRWMNQRTNFQRFPRSSGVPRYTKSSFFSTILSQGYHGTIAKYKNSWNLNQRRSKIKKFRNKQAHARLWTNIRTFFKR